ncbi:hypothetical protein MP228_010259 [Amoeboaphelidium protococcarum]|nr:hypothetical protein MP228_010259 [Amoeboaphelidium protococcarum]
MQKMLTYIILLLILTIQPTLGDEPPRSTIPLQVPKGQKDDARFVAEAGWINDIRQRLEYSDEHRYTPRNVIFTLASRILNALKIVDRVDGAESCQINVHDERLLAEVPLIGAFISDIGTYEYKKSIDKWTVLKKYPTAYGMAIIQKSNKKCLDKFAKHYTKYKWMYGLNNYLQKIYRKRAFKVVPPLNRQFYKTMLRQFVDVNARNVQEGRTPCFKHVTETHFSHAVVYNKCFPNVLRTPRLEKLATMFEVPASIVDHPLHVSAPLGSGAIAWQTVDDVDQEAVKFAKLLNFLEIAGPSGTTDMILNLSHLFGMNQRERDMVLLQCLLYLVPQHHSIIEIQMGFDGNPAVKRSKSTCNAIFLGDKGQPNNVDGDSSGTSVSSRSPSLISELELKSSVRQLEELSIFCLLMPFDDIIPGLFSVTDVISPQSIAQYKSQGRIMELKSKKDLVSRAKLLMKRLS